MSIYRHNRKTEKAENTISARSGKSQRTWIHALAVMLFCMVLSIGTIVFADEVPATVIVAGAKIRASADTSSEALAGVKSGDTLSICGQTTGADGNVWYQVYVDSNTKGFIRSDLIQKKTDGSIATVSNTSTTTTNTTTTANVDTSETQVTPVETRTGTVVTNNVRIRKGASTQHDVVATANKGMVLTVTGEAAGADGKTWYQVSFSYNNKEITGFIRSDLVTFDSVSPDTAVSEITGTEETPEETSTEAVTEETQQEPVAEEQPQEQEPEDENANMILMNVEEEVYVLPEFTEIVLKWQDQDIKAFKNGQFYLFYAQKQNGETGWFLYDSENGVYQRYVYDTADATVPEGSTLGASPFLLIILGVVIVILIAIIGLMFIKLREYTSEYYDDEYDDDDEDNDEDESYEEEELEEEELEEEEEEPVPQPPVRRPERPQQARRPERPQSPQGSGQPTRRPERPQQGNGQQPTRRPERPQQENGQQPTRRPERPQQGSGQQPTRCPERPQQENGQQPTRRPERPQQGNAQPQRRQPGEPQQKRPTKQQNRPTKDNQVQQNGRRAKNFLDSEDDDMEFIDI